MERKSPETLDRSQDNCDGMWGSGAAGQQGSQ